MSDWPSARTVGQSARGEVGGLAGFEGDDLGHCDQQGKGGDGGYAGNAGEDGEAISEARSGFDDLEDRRFDSGHLPIDLFEALSVLTFQQRERQNLSAVFGSGSILHQASRAT